jgi:hypothetical protein
MTIGLWKVAKHAPGARIELLPAACSCQRAKAARLLNDLACRRQRLLGIDVNTPGEVVAVSEQVHGPRDELEYD